VLITSQLHLIIVRIFVIFAGKLSSSTKKSADRDSTNVVSSTIQDITTFCYRETSRSGKFYCVICFYLNFIYTTLRFGFLCVTVSILLYWVWCMFLLFQSLNFITVYTTVWSSTVSSSNSKKNITIWFLIAVTCVVDFYLFAQLGYFTGITEYASLQKSQLLRIVNMNYCRQCSIHVVYCHYDVLEHYWNNKIYFLC